MSDHPHILVVDDDPLFADVLSILLEKQGLRISIATNGLSVTQFLLDGPIDAVITDLTLPGYNVADLIAKARHRNIPIIVLTADDQAAQPLTWLDNLQILYKPAGILEIQDAVRQALA